MRHALGMAVMTIAVVLAISSHESGVTQAAGGAQATATPPGYRAPRTPYGQPDLQGIWQAVNSASWDIQDHEASLGVPAGLSVVVGNDIPYTPAALKKKQDNFAHRATVDPDNKCYSPGVPRITYMPFPFQIFQAANYVVMTYEYQHITRLAYLNKPHPQGALSFWIGDSRAHFEGETLVVDVIDFNDETWFDHAGNHHSDALHVVERYTRTDPDHMNYEVTIEDPKVFTRPWKMQMPLYRRTDKNLQLLEYECVPYLEEVTWPKPKQ